MQCMTEDSETATRANSDHPLTVGRDAARSHRLPNHGGLEDNYFHRGNCNMYRVWILLAATLLLSASRLTSQSAGIAQDFTFQVSASQGWTDTGLDLQPGDTVRISSSAASSLAAANTRSAAPPCDPAGLSGSVPPSALPLPNEAPGALIAKLHAHGAVPVLVGNARELHVEEASHLFLGMNASAAVCQGELTVRVEKTAASATAASPGNPPQSTRGEQLKSQLSTAAQVFLSGQFGLNKSDSTSSAGESGPSGANAASAATPPLVSTQPIDRSLRKNVDSLPKRVNDQFNNLGDMVNFVIIGSQKDIQAALEAANWHVADTSDKKAALNALMDTYDNKDYLAMPMSTLYLFGRKQDFGYEMAEPIAMVASRHHFRIWKAPFTWNGSDVWVGAGTHDIGFAKDKRNNNVTHRIDPAVDGERDNIGSSLQKTGKTKMLTYYLPPDPVQDAKNATGDSYHSDGRLLVIFLQ